MANDELINPGSYISPGYAVASTIDNILQQHRMEKRQAMLDELERQKTEASIYETRTRADAYKAQQEAEAEWRKSEAGEKFTSHFSMGQNLDDAGMARAKSLGVDSYFPSSPQDPYAADVPYSYQPGQGGADDSGNALPERVAPPAHKYVGSSAEQKEAGIEKNIQAYLDGGGTGDAAKDDALHQLLIVRHMGIPVSVSAESFMKDRKPTTQPVFGVDPVTHKMIPMGETPEGSKVIEFSRPPGAGQRTRYSDVKEETDLKTGQPTGRMFRFNQDAGKWENVTPKVGEPGPNPTITAGGPPAAPGAPPSGAPTLPPDGPVHFGAVPVAKPVVPNIPKDSLDKFVNPKGAGGVLKAKSPAWANARANMRIPMIENNVQGTPELKQALKDYFLNYNSVYGHMSVEDAAKAKVQQGKISPDEQAKFIQVVNSLSD